jgi:hypothetical protein
MNFQLATISVVVARLPKHMVDRENILQPLF